MKIMGGTMQHIYQLVEMIICITLQVNFYSCSFGHQDLMPCMSL